MQRVGVSGARRYLVCGLCEVIIALSGWTTSNLTRSSVASLSNPALMKELYVKLWKHSCLRVVAHTLVAPLLCHTKSVLCYHWLVGYHSCNQPLSNATALQFQSYC